MYLQKKFLINYFNALYKCCYYYHYYLLLYLCIYLIFNFSGAVGVMWTIVWMMLTYDKPANHPRISIKEKEYIQSTIGSGQDVITRVRPNYLTQRVTAYNYCTCALVNPQYDPSNDNLMLKYSCSMNTIIGEH